MSLPEHAMAALQSAVESSPGNLALRVHLAGALLDAGRVREADEQARAVLVAQPDHGEALVLAERAARALGDGDRVSVLQEARRALAWRDEVTGDSVVPRRRPRARRGF